MKQVSDPAVLLALHTYFPDMLLLKLLNFNVPVFSSETTRGLESTIPAETYQPHKVIPIKK